MYRWIQWEFTPYTVGTKWFDPLLILYICTLTKKWSVYNFNGRFIWTVRDQNNNTNIQINAFQKSYKLICILISQISIWSPINQQDFWLPGVYRSNQSICFLTSLHHGQDQRAVQGYQGQVCRPTQDWNVLQDHRHAAWWEGDNSRCNYLQMEETQNNCQSSSDWGSMKDLTSWSFSDHENGEDSAQNYTSMISRQLAPYSPRKHLVTHYAVKDRNPAAPARFLSSRKHMYRPVWSLPMIQRRTGWKCCGQMRTKSSSLASTQLAVFGGGGMLLSQEHHPHRQTRRWKHYAFGFFWGGVSAKGTGQLHRIKGMMDGTMYRQGQGIEASQGIENGSWMGVTMT